MSAMLRVVGVLSVFLVLTAAGARAQDCTGDTGFELSVLPAEVAIGANFNECLTTPPGNWTAYLFVSLSAGPTPSKVGELCVGLPFVALFILQMPPEGVLCLADRQLPCDPNLIGVVGHFQFVAVSPDSPGTYSRSNGATLTLTDGPCNHPCGVEPGDFVTYTQGGWGAKCSGNNAGCLRDAHFASVFPAGLVVGDPDGPDADGDYALLLTSSMAAEAFLPQPAGASALGGDETDPLNSSANGFAGQLVAATISVAFDDAGVFDGVKGQPGSLLGDLVLTQGVNSVLVGLTVRELLDLCNLAISGAVTEPIDVNGGTVTLADLSSALNQVNLNFDNGTANNGVLCKP